MAFRVVNKLDPEHETLCESLAIAEVKLDEILKRRKAEGCLVSEIEEEDGRLYRVSDAQGQLVGIYYVDE